MSDHSGIITSCHTESDSVVIEFFLLQHKLLVISVFPGLLTSSDIVQAWLALGSLAPDCSAVVYRQSWLAVGSLVLDCSADCAVVYRQAWLALGSLVPDCSAVVGGKCGWPLEVWYLTVVLLFTGNRGWPLEVWYLTVVLTVLLFTGKRGWPLEVWYLTVVLTVLLFTGKRGWPLEVWYLTVVLLLEASVAGPWKFGT